MRIGLLACFSIAVVAAVEWPAAGDLVLVLEDAAWAPDEPGRRVPLRLRLQRRQRAWHWLVVGDTRTGRGE